MLKSKAALIFALMLSVLPAPAQNAAQLLDNATEQFNSNNAFMGVDSVKRACEMMRANPSAVPGKNYLSVATKTVNDINIKIQNSRSIQTTTQLIYAVQPLLNSLCEWDSNNPRWHYEKGIMFRALSGTLNDQHPVHLESAIKEFKGALAVSGGGQYGACAKEMLARCQSVLARRRTEIAKYQETHPLHNQNNQARPSSIQTSICVGCGRENPAGFRCPFCGQ